LDQFGFDHGSPREHCRKCRTGTPAQNAQF
jgi:hypothetical protein